jgi:hypothetical protein
LLEAKVEIDLGIVDGSGHVMETKNSRRRHDRILVRCMVRHTATVQ